MKSRTITIPRPQDEKLSELKREKEIISDYRKGVPILDIAEKHHVGYHTIKKMIKNHGCSPRIKNTMRYEVIKLLSGGDYTVTEISEKLKVNLGSLKSNIPRWKIKKYKCRCGQAYIYTAK